MKPKVGDLVRDRITGFEGVVIARTEWLNNCVRVLVQPKELYEGKPVEAQQFDEEQIDVKAEGDYVQEVKEERTGGDKRYKPTRP